jgi:hypothetical protein
MTIPEFYSMSAYAEAFHWRSDMSLCSFSIPAARTHFRVIPGKELSMKPETITTCIEDPALKAVGAKAKIFLGSLFD